MQKKLTEKTSCWKEEENFVTSYLCNVEIKIRAKNILNDLVNRKRKEGQKHEDVLEELLKINRMAAYEKN